MSVASFKPVSARKLTVAWKRFAFLRQSMTMFTSSLRSWFSIPSSALSKPLPKIDLLRSRPRRYVSGQLCYGLDGLDPSIHVCLERIEEGAVAQCARGDLVNIWTDSVGMRLFYSALDDRVDDEVSLRNFDIFVEDAEGTVQVPQISSLPLGCLARRVE